MKRCSKCKVEKRPDAFYASRTRSAGRQSWCIQCLRERKRGRDKWQIRLDAIAGTQSRFWSKVERGSIEDCWPWLGSVGSHGYGQLYRCDIDTDVTTHRYSFELHHGPVPDGLHVLHACDNRVCVNPYHLHAGTPAENVRQMMARGRHRTAPHKGSERKAS